MEQMVLSVLPRSMYPTGLMIGILTIAKEQTAVAPVFGMRLSSFGAGAAVTIFAALALLAGLFRASAGNSTSME
ncbi:hypothetical protein [Ensifer sp. NM-2]|uniref:hypothetical protein n=1 Tax=Ensifer sp. NM-2 TaxID=2109730 RepID=UPI0018EBC7BF|nr:hypothetical protein [Ensifer sp. NM-2]